MTTLALRVLRVAGLLACVGFAEAVTSADDNCVSETTACNADVVCTECLATTEAGGVNQADCGARYPEASTFCELIGASYCCILADDDEGARSCMDVSASYDYWSCILGDVGCSVEDMPCYSGGTAGGGVGGATPAPATGRDVGTTLAPVVSGGTGGATPAPAAAGGAGGATSAPAAAGGVGGTTSAPAAAGGAGGATSAPVAGGGTGGATSAPAVAGGAGGTTSAPAAAGGVGGATSAPVAGGGTGGATSAPATAGGAGGATSAPAAAGGAGGDTPAPAAGVGVVATPNPVNPDSTCSNGLSGVEGGGSCCVTECGLCGGVGCGTAGGPTLTGADCCANDIQEAGVLCDDVGVAPCVISQAGAGGKISNENSTCTNGFSGIESGGSCCVLDCGTCGGTGCAFAGAPNLDASDCCATEIQETGVMCDVAGAAPCIVTDKSATPSPAMATSPTAGGGTGAGGATFAPLAAGTTRAPGATLAPVASTSSATAGGGTGTGGATFAPLAAGTTRAPGATLSPVAGTAGGGTGTGGATFAPLAAGTTRAPGATLAPVAAAAGGGTGTGGATFAPLAPGTTRAPGATLSPAAPTSSDAAVVATFAPLAPGTTRAPGATLSPVAATAREGTGAVVATFAPLAPGTTRAPGATLSPVAPTSSDAAVVATFAPLAPGTTRAPGATLSPVAATAGGGTGAVVATFAPLAPGTTRAPGATLSPVAPTSSDAAVVATFAPLAPGTTRAPGATLSPVTAGDKGVGTSTSSSTEPLVSATSWDELKAAIEEGESGTFEIASDVTCDETIVIADGQSVNLKSADGAPDGKYSVGAGSPFMGGTSASTSTASDGAAGGDNSMFVVESGGALKVNSIAFNTSLPDGTDGSTSNSTSATDSGASGTSTPTSSPTSAPTATGSGSATTSPASDISDGAVRAIYTAGDVTVEDCDFVGEGEGASAQVANGGAIYMADASPEGPSTVSVVDSSFEDNAVTGRGGAVFADGSGPLEVSGSTFTGNSAGASTGRGGAIYAGPGVSLNVSDSTFDDNSAGDGGAIATYGGTLTRVTVVNSTTSEDGYGAVVSNESGGESSERGLAVSSSTFEDNSGGGLAAFNTDVNVSDSTFTGNDGALYFETSDTEQGFDLKVDGVTFGDNNAPPASWGASAGSTSNDLLMKSTANGEVEELSTADFTSVSCATDSECAMTVDDESFEVTGEELDCGVCNEDGETMEVLPAISAEGSSDSDDGDDIGRGWIALIALAVIFGILFCCCMCFFLFGGKRRRKREEQPTPDGTYA